MNIDSVLKIVEKENLEIKFTPLKYHNALIIKEEDKIILIVNSQVNSEKEITLILLHELGHYFTGSFYTLETTFLNKLKCEARANTWVLKQVMPIEEIKKCLNKGMTEVWELAEYFDVPKEWVVFRLNLPDIKNLGGKVR